MSWISVRRFSWILLLSGIALHSAAYVNADSAWLLIAAQKWLQGGALYTDIMETNPPLIVWLMAIPAWLNSLTGIALPHVFFALLGLGLCGSFFACERILREESPWLMSVIAIAFVWAVGPSYGEREQIFLAMALPFLLQIVLAAKTADAVTLTPSLSPQGRGGLPVVLSAILASIGMALKPFFVLALLPIIANIRDMSHRRRPVSIFTYGWIPAFAGMTILWAIYAAYLWWGDRSYVEQIVPQLSTLYLGYYSPLDALLKDALEMFALFQAPAWAAFFSLRGEVHRTTRQRIVALALLHLAMLLVLLLQRKGWANHYYVMIATGVLLNGYVAIAVSKFRTQGWCLAAQIMAITILGTTLWKGADSAFKQAQPDADMQKTIALINTHAAGKNVFSLSFDINAAFPAVLYSDAIYGARYHHLWPLPYFAARAASSLEKSEHEKTFREAIAADFIRTQPTLVVVTERADYQSPFGGKYPFDFVAYFSQNPAFAEEWKHYTRLTQIGEQSWWVRQ